MSRLFMSLYLDEDVDVRIGGVIRNRGFSVVTCREGGLLGKSDDAQLEYATQLQSVIVTHNRVHFEQLARQYIEARRRHSGIIVAVRRPYYDIARRLLVLLNQTTADEMSNQLLYI